MVKQGIALALLGAAIGCASLPRESADSMKQIDVIAHRGASAYAPENTLAAFRLAAEQHADWFELDCHLTAEGDIIVIHDSDVERTTNGTGNIHTMTVPQLKAFDAGSWKDAQFAGEPLPTLAEALDMAKNTIGVYIEIKDQGGDDATIAQVLEAASSETVADDALKKQAITVIEAARGRNLELTRKVIALVRDRGMENEVVIQSFAPLVCTVAAIEAPDIRVELLGYDDEDRPQIWETYLRFLYLFPIAGMNTNAGTLSQGRLAAIQAADRTVAVWTVDKDEDIRKYATWGVDCIITNRPDNCLAILSEMGRH